MKTFFPVLALAVCLVGVRADTNEIGYVDMRQPSAFVTAGESATILRSMDNRLTAIEKQLAEPRDKPSEWDPWRVIGNGIVIGCLLTGIRSAWEWIHLK